MFRTKLWLLVPFCTVFAFGVITTAEAQDCGLLQDCTSFLEHKNPAEAWGAAELYPHSGCDICIIEGYYRPAEDCHPFESACLPQLPEPVAAIYKELTRAAIRGDAYAVLKGAFAVPAYVRYDAKHQAVYVSGCGGAVIASVSVGSDGNLAAMARGYAAYRELLVDGS